MLWRIGELLRPLLGERRRQKTRLQKSVRSVTRRIRCHFGLDAFVDTAWSNDPFNIATKVPRLNNQNELLLHGESLQRFRPGVPSRFVQMRACWRGRRTSHAAISLLPVAIEHQQASLETILVMAPLC